MKRLIVVVCALSVLCAQSLLFPQTADAAGAVSIKTLDVNVLVGMTGQQLTGKYGAPNRKEQSEYGFTWYVYNRDYKNFFMAGVRDDKVVAAYTNARALTFNRKFVYGSTKTTVRTRLGNPITYISSSTSVRVLNNTSQRDIYPVGSNYVIVFFDNIVGGRVTSVLVVPQTDENSALLNHPALNESLVAAYERISVDLINAVRVRAGLNKLTVDTKNTQLADYRSRDMRDRNYFDHYTPAPEHLSPAAQAKKMGIKYVTLGENIAYGDHNAIFAHEAFMNSSGHRDNMMRASYTKIGAGVSYGGSRYVLLTNIFTR